MKAQRVFVTGASGFVGAAVVRQLVEEGRSVAVLLRPASDTWRLADILHKLVVIQGDMERIADASGPLGEFRPEAVAHVGWSGVKGRDRNAPEQIDNVGASIELYKVVHGLGATRFVGLGSQAEYGPCPAKVQESTPTRPTTLYGAAKLATYLLIDRLAANGGIPFAWLRLFSSYGPKDDPSWLLPYVIRSLLAGEQPALTPGEQLWDYIFVDDVASAIVATLDSNAVGAFNLGSGQASRLRGIIENLRDLIDPTLSLGFGQVPYRPDQVMHLEADISALTASTGWRPRVALDKGLRLTVDSYRNSTR